MAQDGDQFAIDKIVEMYKPLMIKEAIVSDVFDEDLYQKLSLTLLRCILKKTFSWRKCRDSDVPFEHGTRIRTNNAIERLNREIRCRTRVVGTFPDDNSALMLVCARLRHVVGTQWGNKKYMNMKHMDNLDSNESDFIAG